MRFRQSSQRELKWLQSRKRLLKQLKAEVRRRVGPLPQDLESRASSLSLSRLGGYRPIDKVQLLNHLKQANCILSGDFHAHGSSQRLHLKILREVAKERSWTLVLECFPPSANRLLSQFLKRKISLDQLRRRSRFDQRWGFSFANYSPLLILAQELQLSVVGFGLDQGTSARLSLARQDLELAERLQSLQVQSHAALFCVVGEFHLGGIARALRPASVVELYSNSEALYFDLARQRQESRVEAVRFSRAANRGSFRFGLICSPPWVPWQSYLLHLDQKEEQESDSQFDPTDALRSQALWLMQELGLDERFRDCENHLTQIVLSNAAQSEVRALQRRLKKGLGRRIERLTEQERSFWIPELGAGVLGEASVNHISALAMEWVHAVMSERDRFLTDGSQDFFRLSWVYSISFFGSKIVNHNRRSPSFLDLRDELKSVDNSSDRTKALELAVRLRLLERGSLRVIQQGQGLASLVFQMTSREKKGSAIREASALIMGRMLGDRLYRLYREGGLSELEISKLLQERVLRKDFVKVYTEWVRRIDRRMQLRGLRRESVRKSERL